MIEQPGTELTNSAHHFPPITILGGDCPGGSYVLRLAVQEPIWVSFGRFKGGQPIEIPAGECLYVGSAMKGLGRRLVRHASRSDPERPHPIRPLMLDLFPKIGLIRGELPSVSGKKLHWNVDHLLDRSQASLTNVIILRSSERLETRLGQFFQQEPCTFVLARGLGANDIAGNTHLLGLRADEAWWCALPERLQAYV